MNTLQVFEWQSYSCNNSSDYRLVAEFETSKAAQSMRKELTKFFAQHAKQHDKNMNDDDYEGWPGEPTKAAIKLGAKYGVDWSEFLIWGEEGLEGDEPHVMVLDKTLVLYHTYSSGGFGPDIPEVLASAGAKLPEKSAMASAPIYQAEFSLPAGAKGEALRVELEEFFEQRTTVRYKSDWQLDSDKTNYAWGEGNGDPDDVTFWMDGGKCVFTYSMRPEYLEHLKKYLKKRGAQKLSLRFASVVDVKVNGKLEKALLRKKPKTKPREKEESGLFAGKAVRRSKKPKVHVLFEGKRTIDGPDDIVVTENGVVMFAGDTGRTQRIASKDLQKRTVSTLKERSWLQGVWVDEDSWLVGSQKNRLMKSTDEGRTWKALRTPMLTKLKGKRELGRKGVWSVVRHEGELWVGGAFGVARQTSTGFKAMPLPGGAGTVERLQVVGGTLYVVGSKLWRWNGKKMMVDIRPKQHLKSMCMTSKGTLIVAGQSRIAFRKAKSGKWTQLSDVALSAVPRGADGKGCYPHEHFLVAAGDGFVVIVGKHESSKAFRISEDDGKTFQVAKTGKWISFGGLFSAVTDRYGGVLAAGCGGLVFRISRDGIAPYTAPAGKTTTKKVAAKKTTKKVAAKKTTKKAAAKKTTKKVAAKKTTRSGAKKLSGKSVLFTGKLATMTRKEAAARVDRFGGTAAKSVNRDLDLLVVGDDGSPLFGEGAKGSKITKAEKLIAGGAGLRVISEAAFLKMK